jgi:outer membrane protein OmpA-like peptidoglycan-associated protein
MVGSYMDAQERDFRARLKGEGVRVARIGDDLVLQLEDNVLFDGNDLSGDGRDVLERTAELLRHYDHSAVAVGAYTDTSGTPDKNMTVSQQRAHTVAAALVADGVAGPRVGAQGYGATHLKIVTGPNVNEPRNRRIEIHIIARPQA